jgi:hypothetical protein
MSDNTTPAPTGLALLREPFPAHQISKLPKPTKAQTDAVKADVKAGERCNICGGWHHPKVVHLDYVGHAALTDRLLNADMSWTWEPAAVDPTGHPILDSVGGMWIKLTVCGVTRMGYGHAGDKSGGDAIKEIIGDALRNAAMRFGAALDLWHKGVLHLDDEDEPEKKPPVPFDLQHWMQKLQYSNTATELRAALAAAKDAAIAANDSAAYQGLRTEATKLAKLAGWDKAAKAGPDVGDGDNLR